MFYNLNSNNNNADVNNKNKNNHAADDDNNEMIKIRQMVMKCTQILNLEQIAFSIFRCCKVSKYWDT